MAWIQQQTSAADSSKPQRQAAKKTQPDNHRDPYSSPSCGDLDTEQPGESLSMPPSPAIYRDTPGSSMDRNMAEMTEVTELFFSQSSHEGELPAPPPIPYARDAVLLACFSVMLQQELSKACTIITTDLKRDIQGIGEI